MEKEYSVFIGEVALDEYYETDRWPGIADKAEVETLPAVPGGMTANAACVFASLGNEVKFCTALRHSEITSFLLKDLESYGIDTSMIVYDDTLTDAKTMIFLCSGEHTILIPLQHLEKVEITDEQLDILMNAKFIFSTAGSLSLLHCGELSWREIAAKCRANGVRVACDFDVDYERNGDDGRFETVDIAFFNEVGYNSVRGERTFDEEAEHLLSIGVSHVVVTLAEKGCIIYDRDRKYEIPARKTEVADVTGAGDTFCAAFTAMLDELGVEEAARFAHAAASVCIGKQGARAGAVGKEKILECMKG